MRFGNLALAALALSAFIVPARAELITLDCIYLPQIADAVTGTEFTADIDLAARVVRFGNGKIGRIDGVTDRYIYTGRGVLDNRFDRKTGGYEGQRSDHSWALIAHCHRVEGNKF